MEVNPFVGAWRLVAYEFIDAAGDVIYPCGRDPKGLRTYTADGYMCVAIMDANVKPFARGYIRDASDAELSAVERSYISYAGRYEIAGAETIVHHVEVSLWPNIIGGTQERQYRREGHRLTLIAGQSTLVWERVASRE